MKTTLVALASASLLAASLVATPAPVFAQSHGGYHGGGGVGYRGGGGHYSGGYSGGGHYGGGYRGGGYRSGGYYGGGYRHGYYGGHGYHYGYPYYAGAAVFGFALGSAFASPWYYDYPAYSSYYSYRQVDPGPPVYACGTWTWDTNRAAYYWTPCRTPADRLPDADVAPDVSPPPGD